MEEFLTKEYVMVSDQNFDDYLAFMGVSYLKRKAAFTVKSIVGLIKNEDGTYSFIFKCRLASSNAKFTPGVKFIETKADGVKVDALITIEGNKMTHIQTESNGRVCTHVREFYPDRLVVVGINDIVYPGLNQSGMASYKLLTEFPSGFGTTTAVGFNKIVTRNYELVKT